MFNQLKNTLILALLVFSGPTLAVAGTAIVIASDPILEKHLAPLLPPDLEVNQTTIQTDAKAATLTTDEGSLIPFTSIFHDRSFAKSDELTVLRDEYAPDFLVIAWIVSEHTEHYKSYGLSRSKLTVRLRLVDARSGVEVAASEGAWATQFASDSSAVGPGRETLIEAAASKLSGQTILAAYSRYVSSGRGVRNHLRLTVSGIDQDTYFDLRSTILEMVAQAGTLSEPRESYNHTKNEITVRLITEQSVDEYYRALYGAASASEAIGGFDLSRAGQEIVLSDLTRSVRVISVRALSPEQYSAIGRHIVGIVASLPGVSDLDKSYSETDQTLKMEFRLKGLSLYEVDGQIWSAIAGDERFKNLAMGELDKNELEYFFSGQAGSRIGDVIIALRNVRGQEYKTVSTAFADLLGKIQGVRNLRYRFDFKKKTIAYRFQYEGESLFTLDDGLQRALIEQDLFKHVVKGEERLGQLVYVYSSSPSEANEVHGALTDSNEVINNQLPDGLDALDRLVVYIYSETEDEGSEGSGFLVSELGHILTNAHVIVDRQVYVRAFDGKQYRAEVIKTDTELDLALLKIVTNVDRFSPADIGDSDKVKRGQPVIVIGNPLGERYAHSVLTGIVSGKDRQRGLLQLSIPTYTGISGSPVFDSQGQVVAVMVAGPNRWEKQAVVTQQKVQEVGVRTSAEGIGLAIPINHARGILGIVSK